MLYRISEASKITGIPIDTIRYFVNEGIVSPVKRGKYHYYSTWDINYLMDYKKYRSLEISPSEIRQIIQSDDLGQYSARLDQMEKYYRQKKLYYSLLEQRNSIMLDLIRKIPQSIGAYTMTEYPRAYYLKYTNKTDCMVNEESLLNRYFRQYFGFVEGVAMFSVENIIRAEPVNDYDWLLCMRTNYLEMLEDVTDNDFPVIQRRPALYTVIYAKEEGSFHVELLQPVIQYVEQHGYRVEDNIYGLLLAKVQEQNELRRYIGLYIPVE